MMLDKCRLFFHGDTRTQNKLVCIFAPRMRKSNFFSTAAPWLGWWAELRTLCSSGPGTLKARSDPPSLLKPSVITVRSRCL